MTWLLKAASYLRGGTQSVLTVLLKEVFKACKWVALHCKLYIVLEF